MSSNYEANKHLAHQRVQARRAEAERERLLHPGRTRRPGLVGKFRAWWRRRAQAAPHQEQVPAPGARKKAA